MNWQILRRSGGLILAVRIALSGMARADKHGKHDRDDDDDRGRHYYSDHDRDYMRDWYHDHDHGDHMPPGLAKRDQLPPDWSVSYGCGERSHRIAPENDALSRRDRAALATSTDQLRTRSDGGHVVLVNRSSYVVLDIVHFER